MEISKKEKLTLTKEKYNDIIKKVNGNIKLALWELDFHKHNCDINTDYYKSIVKIVNLFMYNDMNNIIKIRNIIFTLMITNFTGTTVMRDIINYICIHDNITDTAKQQIVKECSELEYQLVKGRREIIQFDALITTSMKILHEEEGIIDKKINYSENDE
jgi:DNA polymerase III delta prime subunit